MCIRDRYNGYVYGWFTNNIDKTHIEGLYLNCGWCYGGFKSTPASGWTFAHTIAQDKVHKLNADYSLNRFSKGYLLDEKGLGTKTWIS